RANGAWRAVFLPSRHPLSGAARGCTPPIGRSPPLRYGDEPDQRTRVLVLRLPRDHAAVIDVLRSEQNEIRFRGDQRVQVGQPRVLPDEGMARGERHPHHLISVIDAKSLAQTVAGESAEVLQVALLAPEKRVE